MVARSKSTANAKLATKRAPGERAGARAAYESGAFALAMSPASERNEFLGLDRLDREELDETDDELPSVPGMTPASRP